MNFGYAHSNYARAFADCAAPLYLPEAQGWLLLRPLSNLEYADAMGCYPFFVCRNWQRLSSDVAKLNQKIVSLTLVTDPFANITTSELQPVFTDVFRPYKEHFIIDLQSNLRAVTSHHRRNVRQALTNIAVEICNPVAVFDEWVALYEHLIQRHNITGIATFSRASFATQWQVPGLTILRAIYQNETVGMTIWYRQDDRVYYHLAAYSPRGYELKASYALFHHAIEHFTKAGARWIALGAGAGMHNDGADGLTRFKRGWATDTRTVYLCGKIFNRQAYAELSNTHAVQTNSFFPAYRAPNVVQGSRFSLPSKHAEA